MRGLLAYIFKSCLKLLPIALVIAFIFGIIGPSTAYADPGWYSTSWLYRKKITIHSSSVTATQTDFPVLISLPTDSDLASHAQPDFDDILFTAGDEITKLPHEIESYNGTTGKLVAWVKIPSLSYVTDTDIYMYYGNATTGPTQNVTNVWDSDFKMVQHLEETTGGPNAIKDSTGNNNHGTDNSTPALGATGKINGAVSLNATAADYIYVPDSNSLDITDNITLEAWIYPTTLDATHRRIIIKPHTSWGEPYYMYALWVYNDGTGNNLGFGISNGTTRQFSWNGTLSASTWQHVAGTFNGSQMKWYINGNLVATMTTSISSIGANNQNLAIGSVPGQSLDFGGTIDEVRISSTARTADWLKTSYNNQSNPAAFYSLGYEENAPVTPKAIGGKVFTVNKAVVLAPWLVLGAALGIVIFRIIQRIRKKDPPHPPPEKTP
jgi:MSHA biogenesis protein MshQ